MFENDPLLGNRPSIEQLAHENEIIQQKLQTLQQMPTTPTAQRSNTPVWDEIDRITSSLSDQERNFLQSSQEFQENSMAIQEMVNIELVRLVRDRIEKSPEGNEVLNRQLSFVKRAVKTAKEETARRDALLNEYMTQYSDMTFKEFMEMKSGKQPAAKPAKK